MTEAIYSLDSYAKEFDAVVLSCEPEEGNKQGYRIILDRTAFFPEQGGQDSDTGILKTDDKEVHVYHTSIKNDVITHHSDEPLSAGSKVFGAIDWDKRYERMQQHSGEHLVSGFIHRTYGYDNVGFHLGDNEVTLDFNGHFTDEMLETVEIEVNRLIYKNIRSHIWFPGAEELAALPYRSKKELTGAIRIVEFPGCDICACCAPHIELTGEIGQMKILNTEHLKGGTTRIYIACGIRALKHHIGLLDSARSISRLLSAKVGEVSSAVSKLKDSYDSCRVKKNELETRLLYVQADSAIASSNTDGFISLTVSEADANASREIVNYIASKSHKYVVLFIGTEETGYRFIAGHETNDCAPLLDHLKTNFGAKGGGRGTMVQGQIASNGISLEGFV